MASGESDEVFFTVGPFEMCGQIDYPETTRDKYPTILLVPGMPQHDRNGNVKGYPGYNNYFRPIIDTVLSNGYAIFRYDKGGTGKSSSGLSAPQNMLAAYRKMTSLPKVDTNKVALLAIAGGSAHIYRKWMQINTIATPEHLVLLSTGVNDLKLEQLNLPICLIAGTGRILRSKRALERYQSEKGHRIIAHEVEHANEQLCDNENSKPSLFKENGCQLHQEVLDVLTEWLGSFI